MFARNKGGVLYIFVAHTNMYSGNFERDMCAFATGLIGECGVGDDYAEQFQEECGMDVYDKFQEMQVSLADEHGCHRPCTIWPTPGRKNDGMGKHSNGNAGFPAYESVAIFFDQQPKPELIDFMKGRILRFADEYKRFHQPESAGMRIKGFQLLRETTTVTTEELPV
jgi:hypothetical protein